MYGPSAYMEVCVCRGGGGGGGCSGLDEEFSICFVFVHTYLFQAMWGTVNVEVLAGIGFGGVCFTRSINRH